MNIIKKINFKLLLIICLAILLRFYQLGQVPHGITWDEAAIGYNGFAIWHTRRDEWLERLPISFKSFGDYKAPLAIYINSLFTFLFGMNPWAVRLPFAISSIICIIIFYYLTIEILNFFQRKNHHFNEIKQFAFFSTLFLTLSPWHFHFSRIAFESGMAMMFFLTALCCFFKFLNLNQTSHKLKYLNLKQFISLFMAVTLFSAAIYTYHSAKIIVPILLFYFLIKYWHYFYRNKKISLIIILWGLFILRPIMIDSFFGQGLTRGGTLIFSQHLNLAVLILTVFKNLLIHLSPHFLIFGQADNLRHGADAWSVLLPSTYILFLWAIFKFLFNLIKKKTVNHYSEFQKFVMIWLLISLLPAGLSKTVPHANRALFALPAIIYLAISIGIPYWQMFYSQFKKKTKSKLKIYLVPSFIILHLIFFTLFLNYYFHQYAQKSGAEFQDGYLAAFQYVYDYEKGQNNKKKVDKIIFTSDYGQPYIYALFVRKTNPIWYQGGSLIKYEFVNDININDLSRKNTVIVASQIDDLPIDKAEKIIYGSNGDIRFKIYVTE